MEHKFRTLLLDVDGTLLDFKACEKAALEQVFKKYGIALTEEVRKTYHEINNELWGRYEKGEIDRDTVIYTRFGRLFELTGVDGDGIAFEDDYQELLGESHVLMDGALEVVDYLSKRYDLYVVTNGVTQTQIQRLSDSGLMPYMKEVFVSSDTGYQKPQKEYFDYCFVRIPDFDGSRALIVGDSLSSDILGGNRAGISTCWMNPEGQPIEDGIKADFEIKNLRELMEFL
ncbi:YjjG family noncanonical pyrimidine nucleotidase [Anaerolentibacter hominis]|uniref:YjjG family noncanonical pyrimidine nucleotidase n=1 Tax=Anaerolentibacter hominis TaxID=3079009 RepID=UPI0031B884B7